jgi:thiamine biosynthesis lipoprotein
MKKFAAHNCRPGFAKTTRSVIFALAVIFSLSAFLASGKGWFAAWYSGEAKQKFSSEFFDTFDTIVIFTAYAGDKAEFEAYLKTVNDEMSRLHRLFDIYNDYEGLANIKTINDAAGGSPVKVETEILDLLDIAKAAYADTGGAVNAALGPVLTIWHDYRQRALSNGGVGDVPSYEELRSASNHLSPDDIEIDRDNSSVRLRYPDMRLDVGAMAKGFATQRATDLVKHAGLKSGIINAGGNVAVIGLPLDGREAWSIGVRTPTDESSSNVIDVLNLTGGAAVTSGSDQRYFVSGDRRYHHIIDPKTLYPAKGVKAVTVLHPDSAMADVLSTAAFILPYPEARETIERHGADAVWVMDDGKMMMTDGYRRLSKIAKGGDKRGNEKE